MAEVQRGDGSKIKADKHDSDLKDIGEEGKERDAERGAAPIVEKNGGTTLRLEGTRLFSDIPPKINARKSPNSNGSCSPFRIAPLGDFKPFPRDCPSLNGAASSVDGKSREFTPAKDELIAAAQDTDSSNSLLVLIDGRHRGDVKDDKDAEETVSPRGTIVQGSGTSTPRKQKNGVSALTYALQMEADKKDMSEELKGASGSGLNNDTDNGGNTSVQPLPETRPKPESLPWIPILVRGPDGCPVVEEINQESDLRAVELVKPLRLEIHEEGRIRIIYYDITDGSSNGTPDTQNNMDEEDKVSYESIAQGDYLIAA